MAEYTRGGSSTGFPVIRCSIQRISRLRIAIRQAKVVKEPSCTAISLENLAIRSPGSLACSSAKRLPGLSRSPLHETTMARSGKE